MLQTVQRIGAVLDLFTVARPEWTLTEVAEVLEVPRSSVHGWLSSLVDIGLLRTAGRGRYRIGYRGLQLSEAHRRSSNLAAVAGPHLEEIVDLTGETAHVAVAVRARVAYLRRVPGRGRVSVAGPPVDSPFDAHCSAVGKVLLAYRSDHDLDRLLRTETLPAHTRATITDAAVLRERLDEVRAAGEAYDAGELMADVYCLAAPVRGSLGEVVAAVGVSLPRGRVDERSAGLSSTVRAAAATISAALGAPPGSAADRAQRSLVALAGE